MKAHPASLEISLTLLRDVLSELVNLSNKNYLQNGRSEEFNWVVGAIHGAIAFLEPLSMQGEDAAAVEKPPQLPIAAPPNLDVESEAEAGKTEDSKDISKTVTALEKELPASSPSESSSSVCTLCNGAGEFTDIDENGHDQWRQCDCHSIPFDSPTAPKTEQRGEG